MDQIIIGFKNEYGKSMDSLVKSKVPSNNYGKLCIALSKTTLDYDVWCLYDAIKGLGTNNDCLIDILVGRTNKDIITLNSFTMECSPEYSLNSFKIFIERNDYGRDVIKKVDNCKPHKASYVSKVIHRTEEKNGDPNSLDCFVDILVGSTEEENEQDVAFTLRGFKFMVEGYRYLDEWYNYSNKRKCYYLYSYAKIKNMEKFKEERLKKFEELRNKNTQAD